MSARRSARGICASGGSRRRIRSECESASHRARSGFGPRSSGSSNSTKKPGALRRAKPHCAAPATAARYRGLIRNALVAAGNARDGSLTKSIRRHLESPDPLIAEHARWALAQLPP